MQLFDTACSGFICMDVFQDRATSKHCVAYRLVVIWQLRYEYPIQISSPELSTCARRCNVENSPPSVTPHPTLPVCRARAQVAATFSGRDKKCMDCGDALAAVFFAKGAKTCRSCRSDYDRRRSAGHAQYAPVAERHCGRCHELLPASQFHLRSGHLSGLQHRCRKCTTECMREFGSHNAAVPLPAAALPPNKKCAVCNERKPRGAFYKHNLSWDGLRRLCICCHCDRQCARMAAPKRP